MTEHARWSAVVTRTQPSIPARLRLAFNRFWVTGDEEALRLAVTRYHARGRRMHSAYPAKWRRR